MDSDDAQQFCLRWHNHQNSVLGILPRLLASGKLADVALSAGGQILYAHRLILCSCSHYFMDLFKDMPATSQPLVVLVGCGAAELTLLLRFMYSGEVTAPRHLLPSLLRLAAALSVSGLAPDKNLEDAELSGEYEDNAESKNESAQKQDGQSGSENAANIQRTQKRKLCRPRQSETMEKNKKLDRIVENLKSCRQINIEKSAESEAEPPNIPNLTALNRENSLSAADIFAYSNIFMEGTVKSEGSEPPLYEHKVAEYLSRASSDLPDEDKDMTSDKQGSTAGSSADFATKGFSGMTQNIFTGSLENLSGRGPAICPICHKRLSNQYNLRVHMETHAGARHSCTSCGHVSRSRDALRKHVAYRHPPQQHNLQPRTT